MRAVISLLILCAGLYAQNDSILSSVYHISARRVLKTGDRQGAAEKVIVAANRIGGWLVLQQPDQISLRVPCDSIEHLLSIIDSLGMIADRSFTRTDYTTEYLKLTAQIQAKQSLLKQYLAVLDSSGTDGIYPVSRSVADLQQGLENVEGRMRGLQERMRYAEVKVYFSFFDRRQPLTSGRSDFGWLNSVNLQSLLEDFR